MPHLKSQLTIQQQHPQKYSQCPHKCYCADGYYREKADHYECAICKRDLSKEIKALAHAFGMQEYRKSPDGFGTMYFFGICTSGTVSAGLSLATVAAALVAPQYCPILGKIAAASLLIPGLLVFNLLRIEKIQHRLESYYKP